MENAVDALKIAFAVMMFMMALTLSIFSFSQATSAVTSIINMRDRETEYTYVEPSHNLTRTVGIETVVTSMYRAFEENIEIYFVKRDGTPYDLYKKTDANGVELGVSYINLADEGFASKEDAIQHLDIILGGNSVLDDKSDEVKDKYRNKLIYTNGLYKEFENTKFDEYLGEYYQGEGASQIKKRVITYILLQ